MDGLPKEFEFFASLVEQYAASRGTTADKVLAALDAKGKTDFVYGMYDRYHVEALGSQLRRNLRKLKKRDRLSGRK